MIIGIGCDIVENSSVTKLNWLSDNRTLTKIFSNNEILLAPELQVEKYYSSRFAMKEAILKCLGTGMEDGIALNDIEIKKTNRGALLVDLKGEVKKIADQKNITNWHISLSHSRDSSVAFVIAENQGETKR